MMPSKKYEEVIEANHFTEIHKSLLEKVEQILDKDITKFYNSDDANTTMAELWQTIIRPVSFKMIDILLYEKK